MISQSEFDHELNELSDKIKQSSSFIFKLSREIEGIYKSKRHLNNEEIRLQFNDLKARREANVCILNTAKADYAKLLHTHKRQANKELGKLKAKSKADYSKSLIELAERKKNHKLEIQEAINDYNSKEFSLFKAFLKNELTEGVYIKLMQKFTSSIIEERNSLSSKVEGIKARYLESVNKP